MNVTAIICEFNPLHYGHIEIIKKAKQYGDVVIIMSGNFVQRGTPALFDKYERAEAAVRCGADLVLELPYPYSASYAEGFAKASVEIIKKIGICNRISFGAETLFNSEMLCEVASRLKSGEFLRAKAEARLKNPAVSDIKISEECYKAIYNEEYPTRANDILAVEYASALDGSGIEICPIKRESGWSATEGRKILKECGPDGFSRFCPKEALGDGEISFADIPLFEGIILSYLRFAKADSLSLCEGCGGGIAERIKAKAEACESYDEFLSLAASKGMTKSGVRRRALNMFFGVKQEDVKSVPAFTNLLALNSRGRELLGKANQSEIKIITKPADYKKYSSDEGLFRRLSLEISSDKLYATIAHREAGFFLKKSVIPLERVVF